MIAIIRAVATVALTLLVFTGCERTPPSNAPTPTVAVTPGGFETTAEVAIDGHQNLAYDRDAATIPPSLTVHSRKMAQKIYRVAGNVYLAVGYDLANSTMVEGTDGIVIIDTLGSVEAMETVMAEFRKITTKPLKAVIYTHNHSDHVQGVRALVSDDDVQAGRVEIFAHEDLMKAVVNNASVVAPILGLRSAYSFGIFLDKGPEGSVNEGIGPLLVRGRSTFLAPTRTFARSLDVDVAGLKMHLRYAPSETDDELVVWFPETQVLQTAEVIQGECFPNLHTIRGTKYRDPVQWFKTIDMLRHDFPAQHMVPSHGRPVEGREQIAALLTAYRDAIQYTHDQTVRHMNKGLTPDELVDVVSLPPHLASHPWLGEFYGTTDHSVREIYFGYLGWFDGDPASLDPLPRHERATRYVAQMGGHDAVLRAAQQALDAGDYRWAAELTTHLIRVNADDTAARTIKAGALRQLGYRATSINWRNFYLTAAIELERSKDLGAILQGIVKSGGGLASPDILAALPTGRLLEALTIRIDPTKSADAHMTLGVELTAPPHGYGLEIRRGIVEFHDDLPADSDVVLRTDAPTLSALLLQKESFLKALLTRAATIEKGDRNDLRRFFDYFDLELKFDAPLAGR